MVQTRTRTIACLVDLPDKLVQRGAFVSNFYDICHVSCAKEMYDNVMAVYITK